MRVKLFEAEIGRLFSSLDRGDLTLRGLELNYAIQELSFYCRRLSSPQIGVLLNAAASALEPDEVYVNIGVWEGYTLLAAAVGNDHSRFIGVDNFSELVAKRNPRIPAPLRDYGPVKPSLMRALAAFGGSNVLLLAEEFRSALRRGHEWLSEDSVGVAFYDAEHSLQAHRDFFSLIIPRLSRSAVVIIDDWRFPQVKQACEQFLQENPDFRVIFERDVAVGRDPAWWSGIAVYARGD